MDNPYLDYVENILDGVRSAEGIQVEPRKKQPGSGPAVLLFSPHPDDECITGLLPLRLAEETDRRIINIPVTYGSNVERQAARSDELAEACGYLGFDIFRSKDGYDNLTDADIENIIDEVNPEIIFVPHADDWNSRHISTNELVMTALDNMESPFSCTVVETEFWHAMPDANLMVEADAKYLAELIAATSLHKGEVARNPYHLLLPAWMQDNVRRGGEIVGGQGEAVPDFAFATLYRVSKWQDGKLTDVFDKGKFLPIGSDNIKELF